MNATLFYRDGRREAICGMMSDIFDIATQRGAYRIATQSGSVARILAGEWVWYS